MDGIKSHLTPAERLELFRQFKCALRVKSNTVRNTCRLYESQLRRLQTGQNGILRAAAAQRTGTVTCRKGTMDDRLL